MTLLRGKQKAEACFGAPISDGFCCEDDGESCSPRAPRGRGGRGSSRGFSRLEREVGHGEWVDSVGARLQELKQSLQGTGMSGLR